MNRHHITRVEGIVAKALKAERFSVNLPDGQSIRARISARLQRLHVHVVVGDRVLVGVYPQDAARGLIMSGARPVPQPVA